MATAAQGKEGRGSALAIIAALDRNRVIGCDGRLPWRLSEDLKRFKQLTLGHPVIMGRKTYESILSAIGKPLPQRETIVVTSRVGYMAPGCRVAASFEQALSLAAGKAEVFVIGGAQIYAIALPLARRLYLTEIDAEFAGDAFFPAFDRQLWQERTRESRQEGGLHYDFVLYERKRGAEPALGRATVVAN